MPRKPRQIPKSAKQGSAQRFAPTPIERHLTPIAINDAHVMTLIKSGHWPKKPHLQGVIRSSRTDRQIAIYEGHAVREEWEKVDQMASALSRSKPHLSFAYYSGIHDTSWQIRDASFTIIEKTPRRILHEPTFATMRKTIFDIMEHDLQRPETLFSGFRAACALASHGPGEYFGRVKTIMAKFSTHSDAQARGIAREYLKKLSAPDVK